MNKDKRDTYSNDVDLCKLLSPNITAYFIIYELYQIHKTVATIGDREREGEREREREREMYVIDFFGCLYYNA